MEGNFQALISPESRNLSDIQRRYVEKSFRYSTLQWAEIIVAYNPGMWRKGLGTHLHRDSKTLWLLTQVRGGKCLGIQLYSDCGLQSMYVAALLSYWPSQRSEITVAFKPVMWRNLLGIQLHRDLKALRLSTQVCEGRFFRYPVPQIPDTIVAFSQCKWRKCFVLNSTVNRKHCRFQPTYMEELFRFSAPLTRNHCLSIQEFTSADTCMYRGLRSRYVEGTPQVLNSAEILNHSGF